MNPLFSIKIKFFALVAIFLALPSVWAQNVFPSTKVGHSIVRRIAVFPVKAPKALSQPAEEAWWQIREALTDNKRFLVASKNFLVQKDVYQPRGDLRPADAIILGRLLDAQAVVVTYLEERTLHMRVFESEFGRPLWQHEMSLHASLPLTEQLVAAGKKLANDFVASVPYQGFVILDPLKGKVVYSESGLQLVKIDVGLNAQVEVGDSVQFIKVFSDSLRPVYSPDTPVEIFAEGRIVLINREVLTVSLDRIAKDHSLREESLVRLPKEWKRLKDLYSTGGLMKAQFQSDFYSPEISPVKESVKENKPLVTSLTFIFNLAAYLLLAF